MTAIADTPVAESIRRLLDAARHKSADVAAQLHPHWVSHGLRRLGLDAAAAAPRPQRWSAPLAALYGLSWPALDRFQERVHRVALLPRDELRRVLAAVALDAERARVRLCIGQALRNTLVERVGEAAYACMLESRPLRAGSLQALTLGELDAERLAVAGVVRLAGCGPWHRESLQQWVRLALAPPKSHVSPLDPTIGAADVLDRLPSYFPEHAWLFGSSMDRALSASTMA